MEPVGAARGASTSPRRALARVDTSDPRVLGLADAAAALANDLLDDLGPRQQGTIDDHLARVGKVLGAVRVAVLRLDYRAGRAAVQGEWHALGVAPLADLRGGLDLTELPWPVADLARSPYHLDRAGPVANWFNAGSVLAVPALVAGRVAQVVTVCWPSSEPPWGPALLPSLRTLAAVTVAAADRTGLAERASYDELTGLPNRRVLLLVLGQMLARLARGRAPGIAVVFCETAGRAPRAEHDERVIAYSRLLERSTRETDLVGRFDNATLAVLCDDIGDGADALRIGRRLHRAARLEVGGDTGRDGEYPYPVGVAFAADPVAAGVLLRQADLALYQARSGATEPVKLVAE